MRYFQKLKKFNRCKKIIKYKCNNNKNNKKKIKHKIVLMKNKSNTCSNKKKIYNKLKKNQI